MKRIIFLTIILSCFCSASLNAQLLQFYKASQGVATAKTDVAVSLTNPELIMIFTAKQTVQVPVIGTVDIQFKISDGTANIWIYIFRSADKHSNIKVRAVDKTFLGFTSYDAPLDSAILAVLPVDTNTSIPTGYKDSDAAAAAFRNNNELITFFNAHPNPESFVLALFVNTRYDYISKDKPYWGISIMDKGNLKQCAAQAVNLAITCSPAEDVKENLITMSGDFKFYPNPANNQLNFVSLMSETGFSEIQKINSFQIFNTLGEIVYEKTDVDVSNQFVINTEVYPEGLYFVRIISGKDEFKGSFVIVH